NQPWVPAGDRQKKLQAPNEKPEGPQTVEFVHSGHEVKFEIANPKDFIQKTILNNKKFYEDAMLMDAASVISPGDLCIDVGANIGNHTVFLAKICQAQVI